MQFRGWKPPEVRISLEFVFAIPTVDLLSNAVDGHISALHALRREIQDILIGRIVDESQVLTYDMGRLFSSTILICTAIDLLAKLRAGRDSATDAGTRFREFLDRYWTPIEPSVTKAIYNLRNGLTHSFSLYSASIPIVLAAQSEISSLVFYEQRDGEIILYVAGMYSQLVAAIGAFRRDLELDATLRSNFEQMIYRHGLIVVSGQIT